MQGATEFETQATDESLPIAAVLNDGDGAVYGIIAEVAALLLEEGLVLAGAVQADASRHAVSACDMKLTVLPDGPHIGIAQTLGEGASGCRLDQASLEEAVGLVDRSMNESTQFLILNKFGSRESEGAGFRATIARAIASGTPVLVGISAAHRAAFAEFTGHGGHVLPARVDDVLEWCRTVVS